MRTAARVRAQVGVALAETILTCNVVGLLEADTIATVVANVALIDHSAKAVVKKDANTWALGKIIVFGFAAVNR